MQGLLFCAFAIMILTPTQGQEKEQLDLLMESLGYEEEDESLKCFQCDLGLWDACFVTETNCSHGERCYMGRGKAADLLDVKTLGCVKAEECDMETTVELFYNKTIFVMTRHCCDTPFCNTAHKIPVYGLLYLIAALLIIWPPH